MTHDTDQTVSHTETPAAQPSAGERHVEVRRNLGLSALTGGFAAVLMVAFAVRAFGDGSGLDWLLFGVLALITIVHLVALVDGRAPLLVADGHGVRLRQGALWRGIAWDDIDCLEHLPRRGLLRDGHILVDGYDDQQLVVPLTLATTVRGAESDALSDVLAELADGRSDVVEVVPGLQDDAEPRGGDDVPMLGELYRDAEDHPAAHAEDHAEYPFEDPAENHAENHAEPEVPADDHVEIQVEDHAEPDAPRRGIAARVVAGLRGGATAPTPTPATTPAPTPAADADLTSAPTDVPKATDATDTADTADRADTDEIRLAAPAWLAQADADAADRADRAADVETTDEIVLAEPPAPSRATVLPARVELDRDTPARAVPAGSALPAEAAATQAAQVGDETVVLADLAVQPVAEPVVGPDLVAARQRLRLSIDQLSERTRIRPHVIEAMEVDDFGPCGGDFYARGHLRILARVLGVDAGPLVAAYDEHYAHAPVDPRRVFESELATGAGGAIRSTRGGRNWSVLIAAVMGAVLVWSVAQLVMGDPAPTGKAPVLNQSGGVTKAAAAKGDPVKLTLTAKGGGAQLVVRDGSGEIAFDGNLAFGQTTELRLVPPVRIWSSDGSVTYALGKDESKPLGEIGAEVSKTLVAR